MLIAPLSMYIYMASLHGDMHYICFKLRGHIKRAPGLIRRSIVILVSRPLFTKTIPRHAGLIRRDHTCTTRE
jgi:hypothetical protein